MKFQVWCEGYRASGDKADATLLGEVDAPTFREAVESLRDKHSEPGLFTFKGEQCFYWECKIFDNEADARRSFG